jgi:hypothetical protein
MYQSAEGRRYSASLIPYTQVDLAFRTAGYITGVKQIRSADGRTRDIGTGDYVTRGTSLAQIRIQDLKNQADESGAQVDAAVAQHTQAEQDLNRAKALYATQSLTKPDYDQAQARFDSTLAAVNQSKAGQRQAQLSLSDSDLKAPFSGYILARNNDVGTLASPSTAAFTIADTRMVKATFGVPEDTLICANALRTSQLGFIPANLFCICIYAFSMRSWLKEQTYTNRDQAQRQDCDSVADGPRMSPAMQHCTAADTATEGAQVSNRNGENRSPVGSELPNGVFILTKTPSTGCLHHH